MQLETIFQLCQNGAMVGWLALVVAPLARERLIMAARGVALILALAYLIQFFTITEMTEGGFSSLAGIVALFSKAGNVMMGWTHYLAFDLFVGSWEVEDAGRRGVPHWLVIPCLFFTLMLGPIGLLLYFAVRMVHGRLAGQSSI
ncbi:MAG: DUF4281 domain-containing protein [Sphingomonadales bacterium]|jgi:hypothetical protein|nr:DUF4281 domain-containing protein [Sphingomonadales bacterium]